MTPTVVFASFLLLVALHTGVEIGLARRQIRHVAARRGQVPEPFRDSIGAEAHAKAADYTCARQRLRMVRFVFGILLLLGWTAGGGLDALNQDVLRLVGGDAPATGRVVYGVILISVFSVIGGLLDLPFDAVAQFRIEERFGFNRMTRSLWIADTVRSMVVGALLGLPLVAGLLWLMDAAGRVWWVWGWALWTGFNLLLMVVHPIFIAPLFNHFRPLEDEALSARVRALMERCGFSAQGLLVMDGSRRSAQSNAYFTGLGRARRVVFYDTLLARLAPGEVEAVLAHEIGHFRHGHIPKTLGLLFALSLAGFAILGWLAEQPAFYVGLGVTPNTVAPNHALALLLFLLVLPSATFFMTPLASLASRRHEFEADAYARMHTSAEDLSSALIRLTEDNAATLTPDPLYVRFHYSHPPVADRLAALSTLPEGRS